MYKYLILLTLCANSWAEISDIGAVRCFDKTTMDTRSMSGPESSQVETIEGEFCTYTIENLANVSELSRKVIQALFNGRPLIYPEGVLEAFGNNDQTLVFSHTNKQVMDQMKSLMPILDARENFSPNDVVRIKADIYEVNETGLSNLGAGISNLRFGTGINDGLDDSTVVSGGTSGLGIDLRAGALELSGLINAEKTKGNMKRVSQIRGDSYNLSNYAFSDITTVFQAPGAGTQVTPEQEGIKLSAKVSINNRDSGTVVLKDFNFYYGIGEERVSADGKVSRVVNQITIPAERLVLQEGVLVPILSESSTTESSTRTRGFFSFGNERVQESTRLLVYISVDVLSWGEFLDELDTVDTSRIKSRFTAEEIAALPTKCPDAQDVLRALELFSSRGDDGSPVLAFGLDKKMACQSNLKKRIHVNTRGGGIGGNENTHVLTLEQLMHTPVKISGITNSYFQLPWIEFTVALNYFRNMKSMVYHNLVYSRTTDYDISDSFWME